MHSTLVQIIPSMALKQLQLSALVGRIATIIESSVSQKGCWVKLDGQPYMGESEWYVPYESLVFKNGSGRVASININNYSDGNT